jgi:hypothetical protein
MYAQNEQIMNDLSQNEHRFNYNSGQEMEYF